MRSLLRTGAFFCSRLIVVVLAFAVVVSPYVGLVPFAHADNDLSITPNNPTDGATITSWAPSVTWGANAIVCQYNFDEGSGGSHTGLDCSAGGSDIPAPSPGAHTLDLQTSDGSTTNDLQVSFIYAPPAVGLSFVGSTGTVTDIDQTDATIGYEVSAGGSFTGIEIHYATDASYTAVHAYTNIDSLGSVSNPGTITLPGLTCGTTYHYLFVASGTDSDGNATTTSSSDTTFDTASCDGGGGGGGGGGPTGAPTIAITSPQAGSIGSWNPVVDWGAAAVCEYSFDGTAYSPVNCGDNGSDIPAPSTPGSATLYIQGGDGFGATSDQVMSAFTYDPTAPTAITGAASSITDTSATIHGDGYGVSGGIIDHLAMKYATDAYYTTNGNTYDQLAGIANNGSLSVGFDFGASSLACGTTYHYQAYAYNDGDGVPIGYGADETFTTSSCTPPPAGPVITIAAPTIGAVTDWAPSVDWDTSTTCAYSYDDNTFTDVDCSNNGSDIPAPSSDGDATLYVEGTDSYSQTSDAQVSFSYESLDGLTLTVTSLADDGDGTCTVDSCTFRDAIANAHQEDTIAFGEGVTGTITLTQSMPLVLAHDVSIVGPGKDLLTIDFNQGDTYIDLQGTGTTAVSGITFTNSSESVFSATTSDSTELDVSDAAFTNNRLVQALQFYKGTLSITDSLFSDNSASENQGGALFMSAAGDLTIASSTFTQNTFGGGIGAGAVSYVGMGNVTIATSTFSYNEGAGGGALSVSNNSALTITNSKFLHNTADAFVGAVDAESANLLIDRSTFSYNTVEDGGYGTLYTTVSGASITNSTFDNNTVTDNFSDTGGGAIYNTGGFVIASNDTFVNNAVLGTSALGGGAVFNVGLMALINSTFSNNSVPDGGAGDSVYATADSGTVFGNSIFQNPTPIGCATDGGMFNLIGGNVDSGTSCSDPESDDLQNTDSLFSLAGLADNGGDVETIALQRGSPALDIGETDFAVDTDARGVARPQGVGIDSGAYELSADDIAPVNYDGGSGTPDDPYLISTCEQLQGIGQDDAHLAAHYRITQDFSCIATQVGDTGAEAYDASLFNDGAGFNPIGSDSHPFTGTITGSESGDGDGGFTINDLVIDRPDEDSVGIFARAVNATIEHLYLHGAVRGENDVGFVAGSVSSTTVDDIDTGFSQLVQGATNVGGLIGYMASSTLSDSNFDGEVRGTTNVGGLVGNFDGNVGYGPSDAFINGNTSTGTVTAQGDAPSEIGGLVGSFKNGSMFDNHAQAGDGPIIVNGSDGAVNVGGLIGYSYNALLVGDLAYAQVTGMGQTGGFIGDAERTAIAESESEGSIFGSEGESPVSDTYGFGGFIGFATNYLTAADNQSHSDLTIYTGNGTVSGIGGFIGSLCDGGMDCRLLDNSSTGTITVHGTTDDEEATDLTRIGGFAGYGNGADDHTGGFLPVGWSQNYATGPITITMTPNENASSQLIENVGGFFGATDNGLTTQSYTTSDITITAPQVTMLGGFIGHMNDSEIDDSYASNIDTFDGNLVYRAGGFGGYLTGIGSVNRSYAAGALALTAEGDPAFSRIGGMVGEFDDSNTLSDSWSSTDLGSYTASGIGGLIGLYGITDSYASLSHDYYRHTTHNSAPCLGNDNSLESDVAHGPTLVCIAISAAASDGGYFYSSDSPPMSGSWSFSGEDQVWTRQFDGYPLLSFTVPADHDAPDAGVTGVVTATGGTVVADEWNLTNTGLSVVVHLDNDSSLTGGTIQLQEKIDEGTWNNVESAYTIQSSDLGTDVVRTLTRSDVRGLDGFAADAHLSIRAIVSDFSHNSTTFDPSPDVLLVGPTHTQGPIETILTSSQYQGGGVAQGWHADDMHWSYHLPFTFSFYGHDYTEVYLDSNGYLTFAEGGGIDSYTPTVQDGIDVPAIFAYGNDLVTYADDDDIFITDNGDGKVIFRWRAQDIDNAESIANFEIVLNRDNTFQITYGPQTEPIGDATAVGVSDGNGSFVASAYDGLTTFNELNTSSWSLTGGSEAVNGCTDTGATNYDPAATADDGSCTYRSASHGGRYGAGGGSAVSAVTSTANLIASLQAKLQVLLAELAALGVSMPNGTPALSTDLSLGTTGPGVETLQRILIRAGYAIPAGVTGYFGLQTKAALIQYQRAHSIAPASGYFGPITRSQMSPAGLSGQ